MCNSLSPTGFYKYFVPAGTYLTLKIPVKLSLIILPTIMYPIYGRTLNE